MSLKDLYNENDKSTDVEYICKKKMIEIFDNKILDNLPCGTVSTYQEINKYIFKNVYKNAGKIEANGKKRLSQKIAEKFSLKTSLKEIDEMKNDTFDEIMKKYIELSLINPFMYGNEISLRLWLDHTLKNKLNKVVDWHIINKEAYLQYMKICSIRDVEIKNLINNSLTNEIDNREIYLKGIDFSFSLHGYNDYICENLL